MKKISEPAQCTDGPAELFAALTKENQDIVLQLIRLLLSDAAFAERFHALEVQKGDLLSKDEIISFMSRWAGADSTGGEKEAVGIGDSH